MKDEKKTIWVLTGHSESGDDYGPLSFHNKPSPKLLKQIAYDWDGVQDEDGPGDYGSYVVLKLTKTEIK